MEDHRVHQDHSEIAELAEASNGAADSLISAAAPASAFEARCDAVGFRMTGARRAIIQVLARTTDHPGVEELHRRCLEIDGRIAISTLYRTLKILEEAGVIKAQSFRGNRTRYEHNTDIPHDHMIDMSSGKVIDFSSHDMVRLQTELARKLGFRLIDARSELYCVPLQPGRD